MIQRERIIHLPVHIQVVTRRFEAQRHRLRAVGQSGVQVGRVVRTDAVHIDIEGALLLDQRAAQPKPVVDILFGALHGHKRAAAAQRSVSRSEHRIVADRSEARLGDDLDGHAAGTMVFRRKLVARDADGSDLRLRGQRASLETVDADDGTGAGHVLELLLQLDGVVRQRLDLIAREHGPERLSPVRRRFLPVLGHGNRRLDFLNRQHGDVFVLAAAHADIFEQSCLESRKLGLDRVAARRQVRDGGDAGVGSLDRCDRGGARRALRTDNRDGGADNDGAARIHHRHAQRAGRGSLRERTRSQRSEKQHH